MKDKLYEIISQVMGIDADQIDEESSPDTIETWDSLSHLNLVMALEQKFSVSLTPEETMEMLSVKLIRMILTERGVVFPL